MEGKKSIRVPYGFRNWTMETMRVELRENCLDWKPNFAGLSGIVNSNPAKRDLSIEMRIADVFSFLVSGFSC